MDTHQSQYPESTKSDEHLRWPGRTIVCGGSRGLGKQIVRRLLNEQYCSAQDVLSISRSFDSKEATPWEFFAADFTDLEHFDLLLNKVIAWQPDTIIYAAGGGPWGTFSNQRWHSHDWALKLGLIAPLRLLREVSQNSSLRQWVSIGSAIAESKPDPMASSYCAAKHGLRGAMLTIQKEGLQNLNKTEIDVRLYSPGYMNTEMLPLNVRDQLKLNNQLLEPEDVAADLMNWCRNSKYRMAQRIFEANDKDTP